MKNATKSRAAKERPAARKKSSARKKHAAGAAKKSNLPAKRSKTPSIDEIKYQMDVVNDLFNTDVVGKRRLAALDDVYTSDARILPPGSPMISGREAIKGFWANLIQSANAKSAILTSVDVIRSDAGAVEIGKAVLTVEPPGQPEAQMEVKYVVYWKKESGRWKWHVDIWNMNS